MKKKERSELEVLRAENRKQKSVIKQLKKQVAVKGKREHAYKDLEEREEELLLLEEELTKEAENPIIEDQCPNCKKNGIEAIELGKRKLLICGNCNYRETKKVGT